MKTIQITLDQLQAIINAAKVMQKADTSLSNTVEITVTKETDSHTGGDTIFARLKSSYAECNGIEIY